MHPESPNRPELQALAADPDLFDRLSPEQRARVGEQLRDWFFELAAAKPEARGPKHAEQRRRFSAIVAAVDPPPALAIAGLSASYHPSARFQDLRFVPAAALDGLDEADRARFARPSPAMPELAALFVDPEEYAFHSFENILALDRWFEAGGAGAQAKLSLDGRARLGRSGREVDGYRFRVAADPRTRAALLGLDDLDLYLPPQNPASRGGARFIFHSARLAEALTQAFRQALPKRWLAGFAHVNPVFRCNRFEPGDAPFSRHLDTPYFDRARGHISRYTALIYLSGGEAQSEAAPILKLGERFILDAVEPFTCVVFRQDQAHEGAAFAAGRKLFLRTELIYEATDLRDEPRIGQLFAKACYFSGESVFAPALAAYTHRLYDQAAAAHWGILEAAPPEQPYLHKRFRGLDFISNGYDYWFAADAPGVRATLQECAAVAILDALNCKIGDQAFRKQCRAEVVTRSEPPARWIPQRLHEAARADGPDHEFAGFMALDHEALFPEPELPSERICCPFHGWPVWDASRCSEIVDLYQRAQDFAHRRIAGAPITWLGQEIYLDLERFVVEGDKLHVLCDEAPAPVNFAACWNDGSTPENFVDVDVTIHAPKLLLPPILFHRVADPQGDLLHLELDFFRNSWMVEQQPRAVPVPRIRHLGESPDDVFDDPEDLGQPWAEAAREAGPVGASETDGEPWWYDEYDEYDDDDDDEDEDDDAHSRRDLMRELYAKEPGKDPAD